MESADTDCYGNLDRYLTKTSARHGFQNHVWAVDLNWFYTTWTEDLDSLRDKMRVNIQLIPSRMFNRWMDKMGCLRRVDSRNGSVVDMQVLRNEGNGNNATWRCNYCNVTFKGSYFRIRSHLLKEKGNGIICCSKVTNEYLTEMKELDMIATDKEGQAKLVQVPFPNGTISSNPPIDMSKKRRESDGPLAKAFNNETRDHLSSEIARLFYSASLSFNIVRNPYFISAFTYAANSSISGYLPPSYNFISITMLQREKANILKLLQPIKDTWPEKNVSIFTDGWTDAQRRPLINFMAILNSGPMFLKVIDGTREYKDKHYIVTIILRTIEEVVDSIVEGTYPHIVCIACVVHTLNLALKSLCAPKNTPSKEVVYLECKWISAIDEDGFYIKKFIMNHSMRFAMFKEFVHLMFLSISKTRFASVIVMLKRLKTIKNCLLTLVISEQWSKYRENVVQKAAFVKETILNDQRWDKIDYILRFTEPIYDMLRSCDPDESNLHLIYEKWDSMIEKVKIAIYTQQRRELSQNSSFYDVVYNILIARWAKSHTPLHCLAHSLNPRQWFDQSPNQVVPHRDNEICTGRKKCIRSYFVDEYKRLEATTEFVKFSSGEGELNQFDSLQDRWNLTPKKWWITYGSAVPKLQSITLKLLSQPCSSSCVERNWNTYSFIHSMKRNRLNSKRAVDLVFDHTNLRLLSRKSKNYNEVETKR
ncbi:uncharacterized protein LOC127095479 [Lathyrus oleraceus]|uniref:uncharacterized protein LOC127095479 n=1 Tax=Pisum sativum TaxID=3888 RepID=UPI0021D3CB6E|nr:uncharacterized protein LOC127095479 [Pisum sativum]